MTKLRKTNSLEFALQNALKNLSNDEIKNATQKSKSHFLKCSDPDDTHHNISVNDALKLDEILLKKLDKNFKYKVFANAKEIKFNHSFKLDKSISDVYIILENAKL